MFPILFRIWLKWVLLAKSKWPNCREKYLAHATRLTTLFCWFNCLKRLDYFTFNAKCYLNLPMEWLRLWYDSDWGIFFFLSSVDANFRWLKLFRNSHNIQSSMISHHGNISSNFLWKGEYIYYDIYTPTEIAPIWIWINMFTRCENPNFLFVRSFSLDHCQDSSNLHHKFNSIFSPIFIAPWTNKFEHAYRFSAGFPSILGQQRWIFLNFASVVVVVVVVVVKCANIRSNTLELKGR